MNSSMNVRKPCPRFHVTQGSAFSRSCSGTPQGEEKSCWEQLQHKLVKAPHMNKSSYNSSSVAMTGILLNLKKGGAYLAVFAHVTPLPVGTFQACTPA